MFSIKKNAKVIFYSRPINLIKGINGLTAVIQHEMGMEPEPNVYFLFCNIKKDRFKVLYIDGDNGAIWFKRFRGTLTFEYTNQIIIFDKNGFWEFLNKTRCRRRYGLEKS